MICDVCKGQGFVDNAKYYSMSPSLAWERGYDPKIECKRCKGSGFVIGISKAKELFEMLDSAIKNNRGLNAKETKAVLTYIRNKV